MRDPEELALVSAVPIHHGQIFHHDLARIVRHAVPKRTPEVVLFVLAMTVTVSGSEDVGVALHKITHLCVEEVLALEQRSWRPLPEARQEVGAVYGGHCLRLEAFDAILRHDALAQVEFDARCAVVLVLLVLINDGQEFVHDVSRGQGRVGDVVSDLVRLDS